ncbi:DUF2989 domain-containing protein [Rheinheimera sp. F8]|uniref:DUF2989 domain-containing protein n=1 Tax=Rheinheimera sp. F8 TaxID=1763998 RepID=UPI000AA1544E|nr:DUF2989 domain-containing protein [Rheinheimera sp. F8]
MQRLLSSLSLLILLSACGEKELNITQVCQDKPGLCTDLVEDGHCRVERSETILARFGEQKLPSDANKYRLLLDFEKYSKCMELAKGIEHIKLKEKTTARVNSYMVSLNEIKRLTDETVTSDYPGLLYYHWSRHQSQTHLEKFEQAAKAGQLNTPDLKFALARYYIEKDKKLAITTMLDALKLYKAGDVVDTDIYTSLTTLYFKQNKLAESYHWALVAQAAGVERIEFDMILKSAKDNALDKDKIETLADETIAGLELGQFKAPVFQ